MKKISQEAINEAWEYLQSKGVCFMKDGEAIDPMDVYEEEEKSLEEKFKPYFAGEIYRKECAEVAKKHYLEVFDKFGQKYNGLERIIDIKDEMRKAIEEA